ncbi:MAG: hypothetical protein LBT20_07175, partial [Clostridiales bacterium]|nr:hypothetical protein [Clostridiales bacterium]
MKKSQQQTKLRLGLKVFVFALIFAIGLSAIAGLGLKSSFFGGDESVSAVDFEESESGVTSAAAIDIVGTGPTVTNQNAAGTASATRTWSNVADSEKSSNYTTVRNVNNRTTAEVYTTSSDRSIGVATYVITLSGNLLTAIKNGRVSTLTVTVSYGLYAIRNGGTGNWYAWATLKNGATPQTADPRYDYSSLCWQFSGSSGNTGTTAGINIENDGAGGNSLSYTYSSASTIKSD